jgi:hypothetical protein
VADLAGVVVHGDVQPGIVGPEAGRPQQRGDLSAGQVQLQGSAARLVTRECPRIWSNTAAKGPTPAGP